MVKNPEMEEDNGLVCRRLATKRSRSAKVSYSRKSQASSPRTDGPEHEPVPNNRSPEHCKTSATSHDMNESDLFLAEVDIELDAGCSPKVGNKIQDSKRKCLEANQRQASSGLLLPNHPGYVTSPQNTFQCDGKSSPLPYVTETAGQLLQEDPSNDSQLSATTTKGYSSDEDLFDVIIPHSQKHFHFNDEGFHSSRQSLESPDVPGSRSDMTVESPYTPKASPFSGVSSPVSSESVPQNECLKERMKRRLQQNTGLATVSRKSEEEREAALQRARMEASQIRNEGSEFDIGPFFGLPTKVQHLFQEYRGITKLYDWQVKCLQLDAVRSRQNLIYTLPTSGGKTLVAEVLIMRELLCYQKDALLVVPFVSIVQEKVKTIAEFATELGFMVEEYAGSKGRIPPTKRQKKKSLYIATNEKAHSLVNSLIENNREESLGLVVVDELHMIGDGSSRGANLESMLLKLMIKFDKTQIIGMSATLNNIQDLQSFLHAEHFTDDFRPVTLKEYVKLEGNVYSINHKSLSEDEKLQHEKIIKFPYSPELQRRDPDHLLGLVMEIVPDHSCLMFCATKKHCENAALMLSQLMSQHYVHMAAHKIDQKKQLLKDLNRDGDGKVCPILSATIRFGIAYHHSGLTTDERQLVESAYSEGTLCLLTCTSTLAAGVNLPAKRVILRSPYIGMGLMKFSQYKQMSGRAGRAGIDSSGESILIIQAQDKSKVKALLAGPQDFCYSSLNNDDLKGIKSLLLSSIGLKIISSPKEAYELMSRSLLSIQASSLNVDVKKATQQSLQYLLDQKLVVYGKSGQADATDSQESLLVSSLGQATFKGSVDYTFCGQLYRDLELARETLNLATHLHLLYLVTPYDVTVTVDWRVYLNQFSKLSEPELKVPSLIGVPESYVGLRAAGHGCRKKVNESAINRFYLTLMLWDLWNQKSVWEVALKFSQPRGFVQQLLSKSVAFASSVFHFCQELEEFWAYQDLLNNFVKRLAYCVSSELIPLMEVPGVKLARAKQLYAAGFTSLSLLAGADSKELVKSVEHLSSRAAHMIIAAAKNILEEKTAALLEQVETLLPAPPSSQT